MALTTALNSALSGLDAAQQAINVIGNNIANVNTTAFKSSRVEDKPAFYITDASGTASSTDYGGDNPEQRGMGVTVASIDKDFTTGEITSTGVNTDMAINGNGFFVVNNGNSTAEYTRDGSFNLNDQHQLVTSSGQFVQGYAADASGTINAGTLQDVTIPLGSLTQAKATTSASMQGNLNAGGRGRNRREHSQQPIADRRGRRHAGDTDRYHGTDRPPLRDRCRDAVVHRR